MSKQSIIEVEATYVEQLEADCHASWVQICELNEQLVRANNRIAELESRNDNIIRGYN